MQSVFYALISPVCIYHAPLFGCTHCINTVIVRESLCNSSKTHCHIFLFEKNSLKHTKLSTIFETTKSVRHFIIKIIRPYYLELNERNCYFLLFVQTPFIKHYRKYLQHRFSSNHHRQLLCLLQQECTCITVVIMNAVAGKQVQNFANSNCSDDLVNSRSHS